MRKLLISLLVLPVAGCPSSGQPDAADTMLVGVDATDRAVMDGSGPADSAVDVMAIMDRPTVDSSDASLADGDGALPMNQRDVVGDAPAAQTLIEHVVLIVQENHSFDNYFGAWCTAAPGSAPTCTSGPACCEAAPATEPSGAAAMPLTDAANASYSPNHNQACEISEIDNGANDHFVTGTSCSDPRNFAVASPTTVSQYVTYATQYALADRYFQPVAGASSSNDMYLATAHFVFLDNAVVPDSDGHACSGNSCTASYPGTTTIADLLISAGYSFAVYAEGYAAAVAAVPGCSRAPMTCPLRLPIYPCIFDPSDIPFQYYPQFTDNPQYMVDESTLATDVSEGRLPSFAYVKGIGYHDEHPAGGTTISAGETFVDGVVQMILASPTYSQNTLILLTWDESGGYFDHVAPPPASTVDNQPYGLRVPMLALGHFALAGSVSHTVMEHSSVVKFLEFNFLGSTGQLGARDMVVNNIGSLLDSRTTGTTVPP